MAVIVTDKIIVLANARTGSLSVTQYFLQYPNSVHTRSHHMRLEELKIIHASALTGQELVVANVRNPWDVMASWWMLNQHTEWSNDFVKFCEGYKHDQLFNKRMFTHNLWHIDFVIRYETLEQDVFVLCDRLDLPRHTFPHKNKTPHKKDYTFYYEEFPEAVQAVYSRFHRAIDKLGYKYNG